MRIKNLGPPSKNVIDATRRTTIYKRLTTGYGGSGKLFKNSDSPQLRKGVKSDDPAARKADREDDPRVAVRKTYRKNK